MLRRRIEGIGAGSCLAWLATPLALLLLGFGLRVFGLGHQSLWFDEAFSVRLADTDFWSVAGRVAGDPHPPLYFWLLNLWMGLTGKTEFAVRLLSAIAATAMLPVVYVLAVRCFGRHHARLTVALAAVAPFYIYCAQETRMYALLALAGTLSAYACLRLIERPGSRRWLGAYVLFSLAAVYSHYYGLFVVLLENVFVLWLLASNGVSRLPRDPRTATWLGAQFVLALLYLPWAWGNAYRLSDYASESAASFSLGSFLWQIAVAFPLGHSVERINAVAGDPGYLADHQLALALAALPAALVAWGIRSAASGLRYRARKHASVPIPDAALRSFPALWLLASMAAAFLVTAGQRDFTARYLIAAAPAYHMLLARGIIVARRWKPPAAAFAGVAVFAVAGFALWNYYFEPRYWRDDQRSATAFVAEHTTAGEAVILNAAYSYPAFEYYFRGNAEVVGLPRTHPLNEAATGAELDKLIAENDYLWLVLWQDYYSDPDRFIETYLDRNAFRTREKPFRGNIKVRGYRTRSPLLPAVPFDAQPMNQRLGDEVELVGYRVAEPLIRDGEIELDLYWRALQVPARDYTAFVHLVNTAQQVIAQGDGRPALGRFASSNWRPDRVVEDYHRVAVPPFTPPGDYALLVGLYDPNDGRRLGRGGIDRVTLGPFSLARTPTEPHRIPNRMSVDFGPLRLVGFEYASGQSANGARRVVLFWQAKASHSADLRVFVHLLNERGERVVQDDAAPARGSYPLETWQPGEIVRDQHALDIPESVRGRFRVAVGLYLASNGDRLRYREWPWSRQETSLVIGDLWIP